MSRATRFFLVRCRVLTLTVTSTLGLVYAVFLLYLMTSAVTTTTNFDHRRAEDLRYAALKEQNISFVALISRDDTRLSAAAAAANSNTAASWCLFPEKNLGPFLKKPYEITSRNGIGIRIKPCNIISSNGIGSRTKSCDSISSNGIGIRIKSYDIISSNGIGIRIKSYDITSSDVIVNTTSRYKFLQHRLMNITMQSRRCRCNPTTSQQVSPHTTNHLMQQQRYPYHDYYNFFTDNINVR
ncbi:hypothetical protein ElyMa_000469400 [Elysia marginata]|uniref:Right handed beta helix domain-containing protein n=1 Tax=Elysia marginata TaxID=1093978 RepID=A0AAV4FRG9_9GAST|nr:hypothetical protein ElyMa_000469400 [Elysia marginata]